MELKNNFNSGLLTLKPCHTSVSGHFMALKKTIFHDVRGVALQKLLTYFEKYLY
jgi:hypothetical protein